MNKQRIWTEFNFLISALVQTMMTALQTRVIFLLCRKICFLAQNIYQKSHSFVRGFLLSVGLRRECFGVLIKAQRCCFASSGSLVHVFQFQKVKVCRALASLTYWPGCQHQTQIQTLSAGAQFSLQNTVRHCFHLSSGALFSTNHGSLPESRKIKTSLQANANICTTWIL